MISKGTKKPQGKKKTNTYKTDFKVSQLPRNHGLNGSGTLEINEKGKLDGCKYNPPVK